MKSVFSRCAKLVDVQVKQDLGHTSLINFHQGARVQVIRPTPVAPSGFERIRLSSVVWPQDGDKANLCVASALECEINDAFTRQLKVEKINYSKCSRMFWWAQVH